MTDVTVIIPCYNGELFIAQTLESVLAQSDPPAKVIVIDDGSRDNGAAVVERFVERTRNQPTGAVELIKQANAGESKARNVGIDRATTEFVALLDADDLWMPDKLARQIDLLRREPDAVACHTRVFNFNRDLDDRQRAETERTKDDPSVEDLIGYHYVAPSSLVVRRAVLESRKIRFDEAIRLSEDMLFMADLRLAGRLRLLDAPLVAKRVHDKQQSRNPWHPLYSAANRALWVRSRRAMLDSKTADALEATLGRMMIGCLEDRYWRRQLDGFADARRRAAELFPDLLAASKVANRTILPHWLYRLRDMISPK